MSRVTEFPEEEDSKARGEPARGGDDGGERTSIAMPKLPLVGRVGEFYNNIKLEMRKTTWPTRSEVWSTTVVVLMAVIFFGFYLWGVDKLVTIGFEYLQQAIR
ncbi:MAG: preprotein translocase subunit SecE [Blastocatellia bacterium]|nr:preprotein translocase subunit SecE [Blastocatellia bacterium]